MRLSRVATSLSLRALVWIGVAAGMGLSPSPGFPAPDGAAPPGMPPVSSETQAAQETGRKKGPAYQLEKVKEWRTFAGQHSPGEPDAAAVAIGGWQLPDLEIVIEYITKLASQPNRSVRRALSKARIRRLFELTDEEAQQGDLNRILRRGVLLHTDIALLDLEKWDGQRLREGMGAFADGNTLPEPKRHHWEFARRLVDCVPLGSPQGPMVRLWYIATTAHMESLRLLGYAGQNLAGALQKFPSDERILFYAGALHETWASPANQNVLLPRGAKTSYRSREEELDLARQFFEKAIAASPVFAEAHLRLGRVLGQLGHHAKAADELQLASSSLKDPQLLYYAALYLGSEFAALSRPGEARSQFDRAATLCPTAQAPLLALSELAHSGGDAEAARLAAQRVFELPIEDFWNDDPWRIYDLSHVRDAAALIEELRGILGGSSQ